MKMIMYIRKKGIDIHIYSTFNPGMPARVNVAGVNSIEPLEMLWRDSIRRYWKTHGD